MSCRAGRSQLQGNCLQRLSQTWPSSGHMAHPLGPPPQPLAGCQPRTLPRALRGLPTCLQHSRGSRPERAGTPAPATRGQAPGRGRRPSPGQRRTPGRPAASPGQPPYPRRSARLAGKWSLSSAGGSRVSRETRRWGRGRPGGGRRGGCLAARARCRCGGLAACAPGPGGSDARPSSRRGGGGGEGAEEEGGERGGAADGWGPRAAGRGAEGAGRAPSAGRAPHPVRDAPGRWRRCRGPLWALGCPRARPGRHLPRWAPEREAEARVRAGPRRWRRGPM